MKISYINLVTILTMTLSTGASAQQIIDCGGGGPCDPSGIPQLPEFYPELAQGDSPCRPGYGMVTVEEARANKDRICSMLGQWSINRLAGGGSMDGRGYNCKIRNHDDRELGSTLCMRQEKKYVRVRGDRSCDSRGMKLLGINHARNNRNQVCRSLGQWDIARLKHGGSMDGPGYGCKIRNSDSRKLGHSLCFQNTYSKQAGDGPCPAGEALLTKHEARDNMHLICYGMIPEETSRLAGGGSFVGPYFDRHGDIVYDCKVKNKDTRNLDSSICRIEPDYPPVIELVP